VEDVAFRVLAGNHLPDHSTLSRFRKQHADALVGPDFGATFVRGTPRKPLTWASCG
jgi:hypothetical protein